MKKITDERLVLQNLKNIRILYLIQTFGIICILAYDFATKGLEGMRQNPLWLLFMITTAIGAYLSMSISAAHESDKINPKKSLIISVIVVTFISIGIGIAISITDGYQIVDGIILGGVIFICGLIPAIYIYNLRKKQQEEIENE